MILTSQVVKVTDLEAGEVSVPFDLDHTGHRNQAPDLVDCTFGCDDGPVHVDIWLSGSIRP